MVAAGWRGAGARGWWVHLLRHPRTAMTVKAAAAAAIAFWIARHLPEPVSDYSYYAPLGAVVALYPTVAETVRESLEAVAAIALGAALALAADRWIGSGPVVVALVVGIGVALGGIRWLGAQRVYVPIAGMFILLFGQGDEVGYSVSYAGLFLLGAGVAVVLNLLVPSTLLPRADAAVERLRAGLVDTIGEVAEVIDEGEAEPSDLDTSGLTELTSQARTVVLEVRKGARANPWFRRDPGAAALRYDVFQALERVVLLVDDLRELVQEHPWGTEPLQGPARLRSAMADALRELATAVSDVGVRDPDPEQRARAAQAIDQLGDVARELGVEGTSTKQGMVVATLTTTLRRCLAVVTPPEQLQPADG